MTASFVKLLRQKTFGKVRNITSHRLVDISGGREKPKTYRCLVIVPIGFIALLQATMLHRNMLTSLLLHEIEGHCRDFNPQSAFWRIVRRTGLVESAVRAEDTSWQDTLRPYLELSAQIEGIDFMMTKLQFAKNPKAIPEPVRERLSELVGECASEVLIELSSMDRNKSELIARFFKERMRRTSKDTRDYFRKILQEDYNFKDKSISQIGL